VLAEVSARANNNAKKEKEEVQQTWSMCVPWQKAYIII